MKICELIMEGKLVFFIQAAISNMKRPVELIDQMSKNLWSLGLNEARSQEYLSYCSVFVCRAAKPEKLHFKNLSS